MWKPLSSVPGKHKGLRFSRELTSLSVGNTIPIAHVITSWSYVEATFGVVMAAFLKGDGETAAAMYATINGFRAQEDALRAAAARALQGRNLDTFLDVLSAVKPMASTRHHFAHWLWGVCDTLPNQNLLVPPQVLWKFQAAARASIYAAADEIPALDQSKIQVWSLEGLMQAAMDMDLCADLVAALVSFLDLPEGAEREMLYQQMYHQPPMQRARSKRLGKS